MTGREAGGVLSKRVKDGVAPHNGARRDRALVLQPERPLTPINTATLALFLRINKCHCCGMRERGKRSKFKRQRCGRVRAEHERICIKTVCVYDSARDVLLEHFSYWLFTTQ